MPSVDRCAMLRFNFLGFPVTVHWLFWVVMALFGSRSVTGAPSPGLLLLIWMVVAFVSIMAHELGHTLFQRKLLGAHPRILLHGMGGLAIPEGGRRASRQESIIISAMGPVFGLVLWALGERYAAHFPPTSLPAAYALSQFLFVNFWWSLLNLIPVLPLDGGRIMEAAVGSRNPLLAYRVSMVVAAAVAIFALVQGRTFLAMFFGFFAYQNYQSSKGLPTPRIF